MIVLFEKKQVVKKNKLKDLKIRTLNYMIKERIIIKIIYKLLVLYGPIKMKLNKEMQANNNNHNVSLKETLQIIY